MGVASRLGSINESIWYSVRTHRRRYTAIFVLLLLLQGYALYQRVTTATQFESSDAVAEFRKRQQEVAAAQATEAPPTTQAPAQTGASGSQPAQGPAKGAAPQPGGLPAQPECDWACPASFEPPQQGVYEYFQCGRVSGQCTGEEPEPTGTESFGPGGGAARPFPRRGQRIISHRGGGLWSNEHIYAKEHREEFDLTIDSSGVYNSRYKVEVKIGGLEGGSDIRQSPPLKFSQWPIALGQAWNGSWTDTNRESDADYSCKVIAKEEIAVGGQKIRTWVTECQLHLKGPKVSGEVLLKLWLAPQYRNTVQELYDQKLDTPQGPYSGKWMVTLSNPNPKT